MASVRLRQRWESEVNGLLGSLRKGHSGTDLLYLIHPGSGRDCDVAGVAKERTAKELDFAASKNQRAILIYPTEGDTYVDPAKVTDIRGGYEEDKWIEWGDVAGIEQVTFVGGKLRKCLGCSYENFLQIARQERVQEIRVRLPLDSIYTGGEHTAAQEFLAGASAIGKLESLCALLTPINDGAFSYYDKSLTEYGFLGAGQPWRTDLRLNGQHMAIFGRRDHATSFQSGTSTQNLPEITLLVECEAAMGPDDSNLVNAAKDRWSRIQKYFAPYVQARQDE